MKSFKFFRYPLVLSDSFRGVQSFEHTTTRRVCTGFLL